MTKNEIRYEIKLIRFQEEIIKSEINKLPCKKYLTKQLREKKNSFFVKLLDLKCLKAELNERLIFIERVEWMLKDDTRN